jgi:hypothetical protein
MMQASPEVLADVDACRDKTSLAYLGHLSRRYHQSRTLNIASHQLSTASATFPSSISVASSTLDTLAIDQPGHPRDTSHTAYTVQTLQHSQPNPAPYYPMT